MVLLVVTEPSHIVWKHPHNPINIMKANMASLPHFQICLPIFLAEPDLEVGFTQKGLTVTLPEPELEKENAGLVLISKSE
jgi:hypothetical protein